MNSIERLSSGNPIGDQHTAINLCSGIINQYGQLIGEYSRLDDELWFSKPDEDDHDPFAGTVEGFESNFASYYEYPIDDAQLSKSINNPVCDGGKTSVKETSSSLNDSSFDLSQTSSPVYVPRRKRSHSNVRKKANKNAEIERGCWLEGRPEHSPTKLVRMRKVSDLLLSGGRDNQSNKSSNLQCHQREGLEELWSREEQNLNTESISKRKKQNVVVKKCMHCESTETPQWREGPMGRKTLCNACGVQYKKGKLFTEYRPLNSPTFNPALHSYVTKTVLQMRKNSEISTVSEDSEPQK